MVELTPNTMFSLMYRQYKFEIGFIVLLNCIEMACRLGFSVMLQELFNKVSYIDSGENKRDAYIYVVFCGVLFVVDQIIKHNAFY